MILDGQIHDTTAPDSACILIDGGESLDLPSVVKNPNNKNNNTVAKRAKNFRRKRMELRRMRSFSQEKPDPDATVSSSVLKKKRSDVGKEPNTNMQDDDPGSTSCLSHGTVSVIGRRREMEDAVATEVGFLKKGGKSYDFYGVYDGHGGWRVAHACGDRLHKLVMDMVGEEGGEEIDWKRVMVEVFDRMDEEVNKNGAAVATVGSTAVVAVVGEDEVMVANCGDSRAVLSRGGVAVQMSDDHKPDRPDELKRIEVSGGKVINWNGQRILGVLATSRSIGDQYLKPFVITEPEVRVITRNDTDEFLILASDGLWDVVSNDLACQVARRCLDGHMKSSSKMSKEDTNNRASPAHEAAAVLAELAMARGSRDNISVIVVEVQR